MKRKITGYIIISILLLIVSVKLLRGEVIYLKDGQVISGSIVRETKKQVTVKTKYKSYVFKRKDIKRILYGSRQLERIYIQLKDNSIIDGYMVDQDNEKVVLRRSKDSPMEENISKKNIQQMSNESIVLFFPEVSVRTGIFYPLNTRNGADLDPAYITMAGFGIRVPFLPGSRIQFEAGYVENSSEFKDYDGNKNKLSLMTLPLLLNYTYTYKINAGGSGLWNRFLQRSYLSGKLGAGMAYQVFDNGEGEKFTAINFAGIAGLGYSFEIMKRRLFLKLHSDFLFITDSKSLLLPYMLSVSLNYRY
jgi:hypothetical protein